MALNRAPAAGSELLLRLSLLGIIGFGAAAGFATGQLVGSGDAVWYSFTVGDFVSQWRAGVFPVLAGQTVYAFNGSVNPLRFAPYFQHLAGVLDLATGRSLTFVALQNLALAVSLAGALFAAYFSAAAILPGRRWIAAGLAMLYVACPGVLALAYRGDLFLSVMALPFIPPLWAALWLGRDARDGPWAQRTALLLAAAWWCHAPIAFWLTLLAAGFHSARLVRHGREAAVRRDCLRGALWFALAAGFVFLSVQSIGVASQPVDKHLILDSIRQAFPGDILPVTGRPGALGDFQFGWSLWLILALGAAAAIRLRFRALFPFLAVAAALLALLLPIPGLNALLWHLMPQFVCNLTYFQPMQRLYAVLAGLVLVVGAAAIAAVVRQRPRWDRPVAGLVAIAAIWSGQEAAKFVYPAVFQRPPAAAVARYLEPSNLALTRYSFNPFDFVPGYFSHGYIDAYLENRVLSADRRDVLADNAAAARPDPTGPAILLQAVAASTTVVDLSPTLPLPAGSRFTWQFEPLAPLAPGALLAEGQRVFREYYLPDSGFGMAYHGSGLAFGLLAGHRDFFPIWTSLPGGDEVRLSYAFVPPLSGPASLGPFARLRIRRYMPEDLPIRVSGWTPYRASVRSVGAGWLETPRIFIPGYRATVNGRKVPVAASPQGLVLIPLTDGPNDVTLECTGPLRVRLAYYLSLGTWTVAALSCLRRLALLFHGAQATS